MQQNDIYNIPLSRDPGPKKKDNKRGINYLGWIKTSDSSRGHKISTRDGSVIIDSRFNLQILKYGSLFARCVRFEKPNRSELPASSPSPLELPTLLLVPSSTASTFILARSSGGTGN
jgi:hypothetical protein